LSNLLYVGKDTEVFWYLVFQIPIFGIWSSWYLLLWYCHLFKVNCICVPSGDRNLSTNLSEDNNSFGK